MIDRNTRMTLLTEEARRWIGIKERNGDNSGEIVEMFQRAVDQKAQRESWCMCFVMYCLQQADRIAVNVFGAKGRHNLFISEHCLTVWEKSPLSCRVDRPVVGSIAIWQMGNTRSGHAGIVVAISSGGFQTIEGNTGPGAGIVREGDGVFVKNRTLVSSPNFKLLGFLLPY
jgi:hypothetical protein